MPCVRIGRSEGSRESCNSSFTRFSMSRSGRTLESKCSSGRGKTELGVGVSAHLSFLSLFTIINSSCRVFHQLGRPDVGARPQRSKLSIAPQRQNEQPLGGKQKRLSSEKSRVAICCQQRFSDPRSDRLYGSFPRMRECSVHTHQPLRPVLFLTCQRRRRQPAACSHPLRRTADHDISRYSREASFDTSPPLHRTEIG